MTQSIYPVPSCPHSCFGCPLPTGAYNTSDLEMLSNVAKDIQQHNTQVQNIMHKCDCDNTLHLPGLMVRCLRMHELG